VEKQVSFWFREQFLVGQEAFELFKQIAENKGFMTRKASRKEDIYDHIDIFLTKEDIELSVDVKAMKKISRSDDTSQDTYTYVEFKNVKGNPGWIYGKANLIAFETNDSFLLVDRVKLVEHCESVIDFNAKVKKATDSLYKIYSRSGRSDLISMIGLYSIPKVIRKEWKK
jgi:hypothetical protein